MGEGPFVSDRLDSWKEIATYLGRTERTVMRWEETRGLPVHRIPGGQRQAVYAWRHEIDEWLRNGEFSPDQPVEPLSASPSDTRPADLQPHARAGDLHRTYRRLIWVAATIATIAAFGVGAYAFHMLTAPLHVQISDIRALTSDGAPKEEVVTGGGRAYFGEFDDGRVVISTVSLSGGPITTLTSPFTNVMPESISPDGRMLLAVSWIGMETEKKLWIFSLPAGHLRRVGSILCHSASWSPDGKRIAYAFGNSLYITTEEGTPIQKIHTFAAPVDGIWWLPDGRTLRLVVQAANREVPSLWDLSLSSEDTSNVTDLSPLNVPVDSCCARLAPMDDAGNAFSSGPDSDENAIYLISRRWRSDKSIFESQRVSEFPAQVGPLAADRKKQELVVIAQTAASQELVRFDPSTRSFTPFLSNTTIQDPVFSRDGKRIAYIDPKDFSLWTCRPDGSDRRKIVDSSLSMQLPRWSPNGKQIAFMARMGDKPWRIYVVPATSGQVREASVGTDHQGAPTWSPDGKWLVYANVECQELGDCAVHKINLATRQEFIIPGSDGLRTARWSPNGRYIAALNPARQQVMLLDLTTQTWRKIADGINGDDLCWSADSKFLYASKPNGEQPEILRISIPSDRIQPVVKLSSFMQIAGQIPTWFTLAPDNSIIMIRVGGAWDLYAMRYSKR